MIIMPMIIVTVGYSVSVSDIEMWIEEETKASNSIPQGVICHLCMYLLYTLPFNQNWVHGKTRSTMLSITPLYTKKVPITCQS